MKNNSKEYKDEKLEKVVGGIEEEKYQFVFERGDFFFELPNQKERVMIKESVKTNDANQKINCEKIPEGFAPTKNPYYIQYSAGDIVFEYKQNGGFIRSLK